MEPLHITEFASKRYYEKLEQLPKEQQQQQQHHHQQQYHHQNDNRVLEGSSSKFILPIRQAEQQGHEPSSRYGEHLRLEKEKEKEKERRRLFGRLRSSKSSVAAPEPQSLRRPSFTSAASATSIGESPVVKRKR